VVDICDVLALSAHPDDTELGCGATLARLAAGGKRVGIIDLTAGELATRGNPETRRKEAHCAAAALGVAWRACLDLPDGALSAQDEAQLAAIVDVLRRARPRVVFCPHHDDPHPDHGAAARLVGAAGFLAGVRRWGDAGSDPVRPETILLYPGPRQLFAPQVVVDVTAHYAAKRTALACYRSQFDPAWRPAPGKAPPPTHLTSTYYLAAVEGRDRAAGNTIGCELGEGFAATGPLPADIVAWLMTRGESKERRGERNR
jgi:bacillithiol biosynthesis deacetylase BshB1